MPVLIVLIAVSALLLGPRLFGIGARPGREVHGYLHLLWWINRFYCVFLHRLEIANPAPLPERGPAMLIANHTCGIDNFLLQASVFRVLGFLIAQEWYDHSICGWFSRRLQCIPVRRDGRDLAAMRAGLRALELGRVVPIFPEGKITPQSGDVLGPGLPGAAYLALKSGVTVVPAYISGTPRTNSIIWSLISPSHARVRFGPPLDLSAYTTGTSRIPRESLEEVTNLLMNAISALKDQETARKAGREIPVPAALPRAVVPPALSPA